EADRSGREARAHARRLGRRAQPCWRHSARAGARRGGAGAQAPVPMNQIGNQIGKYAVLRKLGEGATSEVYLCHDPFANRDVAVKVVYEERLKDIGDTARLHRKFFVAEASLAGKLQHPHVVQIYDAVVAPKMSYIVMEYVPG